MRLDKFLCEMNLGTRSRAKELIRRGQVTVNGHPVKNADAKVDELADRICVGGQECHYQRFYYFMLNKPAGMVSAVRDRISETVMECLRPEDRHADLFPAGRLDKDTEGFLLLSNDGELAHRLLSPKRHVDKTYLVRLEHALSLEEIQKLEQGVDIGEERLTLPAEVRQTAREEILLTIREGKFHQVKRMMLAVGNGVRSLKRVSFGGIALDGELAPGAYRALTEEEVRILYEVCGYEARDAGRDRRGHI